MMLGKYFSKRELERSATATRLGLSNSIPGKLLDWLVPLLVGILCLGLLHYW